MPPTYIGVRNGANAFSPGVINFNINPPTDQAGDLCIYAAAPMGSEPQTGGSVSLVGGTPGLKTNFNFSPGAGGGVADWLGAVISWKQLTAGDISNDFVQADWSAEPASSTTFGAADNSVYIVRFAVFPHVIEVNRFTTPAVPGVVDDPFPGRVTRGDAAIVGMFAPGSHGFPVPATLTNQGDGSLVTRRDNYDGSANVFIGMVDKGVKVGPFLVGGGTGEEGVRHYALFEAPRGMLCMVA